MKSRPCMILLTAHCLLLAVLVGCESLERKFTRKPKHPITAPSPVTQFQDYTRSLTPLDRYRKHYMIFDYWSEELATELRNSSMNQKRLARASAESLGELRTLQSLLRDGRAADLVPVLEEREALDWQVQRGIDALQSVRIARMLEAHAQRMHRDFFWRDVQDALKNSE